jgi:hypothetical protein
VYAVSCSVPPSEPNLPRRPGHWSDALLLYPDWSRLSTMRFSSLGIEGSGTPRHADYLG